eukprot:9458239-Pyramimonas_sp.AAC.1
MPARTSCARSNSAPPKHFTRLVRPGRRQRSGHRRRLVMAEGPSLANVEVAHSNESPAQRVAAAPVDRALPRTGSH